MTLHFLPVGERGHKGGFLGDTRQQAAEEEKLFESRDQVLSGDDTGINDVLSRRTWVTGPVRHRTRAMETSFPKVA